MSVGRHRRPVRERVDAWLTNQVVRVGTALVGWAMVLVGLVEIPVLASRFGPP